ncbi:serine/threonine-protein kinase Sgk1 isoform X3 [Chiloscyllium punctatum]|uniref:serine/threonine-protein kinase Sgk1 isoform X3 n=1 Tax=Chiloscyllium punctatum TaxID=137246 RepID=UPI003B63551F
MKNRTIAGFSVTKCSAFQFLKKRVRRWKKSDRFKPDELLPIKTDKSDSCASQMGKVPKLAAQSSIIECHCCQTNITHKSDGSWQTRKNSKAKKQCPDEPPKHPSEKLFTSSCNPAFMKQRRMGLNDLIQKIAASQSYACKHTEVPAMLHVTPKETEANGDSASPPPSPMSAQINLGPSSNPQAKPSDFNFLKVIGKGSFGKVLLAKHKSDDQFYAVKVLQKKAILKKKEEKHIMSERNVLLKNVKHPFLVGLYYSFQTADKLYFVLDYINGGELFYHLQRERCFLEPRARFYAAEIASALGYLHSLNIVYRDLKPENILLDRQGHIVLTDFGLCKENIESNGTTCTFCGTPEYLAPEVLHKQPYDRTVDWWCLGAVLYEMLYGLPPFYSRNTAEMYDNILNKPLLLKPNISNAARDLLEGLLQKDRTKRLGAKADFLDIKAHIFFSPINWVDLNAKKLTPPFNPNVSGPSDLQHFDPEFTEEPVPNSIGRSPDNALITASVKEASEAFLGFSYAPPLDSFL